MKKTRGPWEKKRTRVKSVKIYRQTDDLAGLKIYMEKKTVGQMFEVENGVAHRQAGWRRRRGLVLERDRLGMPLVECASGARAEGEIGGGRRPATPIIREPLA